MLYLLLRPEGRFLSGLICYFKAFLLTIMCKTSDSILSMRALAKSIHVSVTSIQKAYEDLQRDGFIETTVGKISQAAYKQ